ncbi:hypothetical protein ACQ4PT_014025 [Festuca glaucescens]
MARASRRQHGAVVLGLHASSDRPKGVSRGQYWLGFFLNLGAAALYGLVLPLVELTYKRAAGGGRVVTLADVARDPVYACLYAALLLFGCGLVSMAWFRVCIHSKSYMNRLVGDQVSVTPAQADSIPLSQWARRVFMVAFAVGFCVGAGVIGSGTGIMLAVTVMHSYFDGGASSGIGPIGL